MAEEKLERNLDILRLFGEGFGFTKIAQKHDISASTANQIVRKYIRRYFTEQRRYFITAQRERGVDVSNTVFLFDKRVEDVENPENLRK